MWSCTSLVTLAVCGTNGLGMEEQTRWYWAFAEVQNLVLIGIYQSVRTQLSLLRTNKFTLFRVYSVTPEKHHKITNKGSCLELGTLLDSVPAVSLNVVPWRRKWLYSLRHWDRVLINDRLNVVIIRELLPGWKCRAHRVALKLIAPRVHYDVRKL